MSYNTGNPTGVSGSSDPRDLYDNSEDIDVWATSLDRVQHPDRHGVQRKTWHGMEAEFDGAQAQRSNEYTAEKNARDDEFDAGQADRDARFAQFLSSSGYQPIGDYAPGMVVTEYNQIFRYEDSFFRVKPSVNLPFTATEWATDSGDFIGLDDATLRQELSSPDGGDIVSVGTQTVKEALDSRVFILNSSVDIRIPSEYDSIQAAIDYISLFKPSNGATANLIIESGHQPVGGWFIENADLGFVTLSSEDDVVLLSPSFVGTNLSALPGIGANNAFITINGRAPTINCLMDASLVQAGGSLALSGYILYGNSEGAANEGCGIIGAHRNLDVRGSKFFGRLSVWRDSRGTIADDVYHNIRITDNSLASVSSVNATGSSFRGLDVSRGSLVYANGINVSNCSDVGIECRRSTVIAQDAIANGCETGYYVNTMGRVLARGSSATGCATYGARLVSAEADFGDADLSGNPIGLSLLGSKCYFANGISRDCSQYGAWVYQGSELLGRGCDLSGSDWGGYVLGGSKFYAENITAMGCTRGVAGIESYINVVGGTIQDSVERGLSVDRCIVDCDQASITGSAYGIVCQSGCDIKAGNLDVSNNSIRGVQVSVIGNFIRVRSLTGTINMEPNVISSLGIYFS